MKKRIVFPWKRAKEKILAEEMQNEYYEDISARLGILQVILYFSLFAFVILSFFRSTNLITYENFYYFFKDLNASAETVDVLSGDSVTYPTSENQSFTLYRKGLAVAGTNSVTVFTATGRQTVSQSIHYQNPVAVGSGKYLLVYDSGADRYSIYNSYTQIHTGTTEGTIIGAAVSDTGMYALITTSEEYSSVISLYNSHFSLLNRYNKNGYVMDVAIRENGNLIAILSSTPSNGLFKTTLELYKPGETEVRATTEIGSFLALSCAFTDTGKISVLCTNGISFVSSDGKLESFFDFEGKEIIDAVLNENGASLCLETSAFSEKKYVIVFDKSGKMLYNENVSQKVEQISAYGNSLYLLTSDKILKLDIKGREVLSYTCNTHQRVLLAVDEDEVLLCSPQKAEYIHIGS